MLDTDFGGMLSSVTGLEIPPISAELRLEPGGQIGERR
jgi:hypothetical protein